MCLCIFVIFYEISLHVISFCSQKNIDEVLPVMYKGLKMIVAGLYAFSTEGLNDNIISDETLKENITQTMHDVRAVLCYFSVSILNCQYGKITLLHVLFYHLIITWIDFRYTWKWKSVHYY